MGVVNMKLFCKHNYILFFYRWVCTKCGKQVLDLPKGYIYNFTTYKKWNRYANIHKFYWLIREFVFNLIRRLTWKDYDANEEFCCGNCGKPMYKRYLYCSNECYEMQEGVDQMDWWRIPEACEHVE